jgi:hypothetical protein
LDLDEIILKKEKSKRDKIESIVDMQSLEEWFNILKEELNVRILQFKLFINYK